MAFHSSTTAWKSATSRNRARPALFEPQKIFWQAVDWHPEYPKFYTAIDNLRRQHPALQQGQLVWLHNSDEQHIVSYLRRAGGEEFLVVVNLSNTPFRGAIDAAGRIGNKSISPYPRTPKQRCPSSASTPSASASSERRCRNRPYRQPALWGGMASRAPIGNRRSAVTNHSNGAGSSPVSAERFSNLVYRFRNASFTRPVGPLRCLARISSAMPFKLSLSGR